MRDEGTSASKNYATLVTTIPGVWRIRKFFMETVTIILATTLITLIPWRHCTNISSVDTATLDEYIRLLNDIGLIYWVILEKDSYFYSRYLFGVNTAFRIVIFYVKILLYWTPHIFNLYFFESSSSNHFKKKAPDLRNFIL